MDANPFVGTWRARAYQCKDAQGIRAHVADGYMDAAIMNLHR